MANGWTGLIQQAAGGAWRPPTYTIDGDSIMSVHSISNSTSAAYWSQGMMNWCMAKAGWPWSMANNAATGGNTTEQILAGIGTGVLQYQPGYAIYNGGWNDLAAGVATYQIIANLQQYAIVCLNAGILPIYIGLQATSSYASAALKQAINLINQSMRTFMQQSGGLFVDLYSYTLDTATGGVLADYTLDGIHFTTLGARVVGEGPLYNALQNLFANAYKPIVSTNDYSNTIANPMLLGTSASGTNGFTATTWTGLPGPAVNGPDSMLADVLNATGTVTDPAARTDGRAGISYLMTPTMTANNGFGRVYQSVNWFTSWQSGGTYSKGAWRVPTRYNGYMYSASTAGTAGTTEPAWPTTAGATVADNTVTWTCYVMPKTGETWQAEFEVDQVAVVSGSGMPTCIVQCLNTAGTTVFSAYTNFWDSASAVEKYPTALSTSYIFRTPPFVIPNNVSRIMPQFKMQGANSATLTMGCNNFRLWKVLGA